MRAAARRRLDPEAFAVFVVGPAEGRDRPLEDFGVVTAVDVTIAEPQMEAADETPEAMAAGAEILDRAVAALGGADRLTGWSAAEQRGSAVFFTPQGEMPASFVTRFAYPDRLRQELALPFGEMVTVLNGDAGYQATPEGRAPLGEKELEDTRESFSRHLLVLLRRHLEGEQRAVAVGREAVQAGDEGSLMVLSLEAESGFPATLTYQGEFAGTPGEIVQTFSDRRQVDGVSLPHSIAATLDGSPMYEMAVETTLLDPELEATLFALD